MIRSISSSILATTMAAISTIATIEAVLASPLIQDYNNDAVMVRLIFAAVSSALFMILNIWTPYA